MNENEKKTIKKLIITSLIIIVLEYFLTSTIGTFLKIIFAVYALKYLKEKDYFAIKVILIILFLPIILGCFLILKASI